MGPVIITDDLSAKRRYTVKIIDEDLTRKLLRLSDDYTLGTAIGKYTGQFLRDYKSKGYIDMIRAALKVFDDIKKMPVKAITGAELEWRLRIRSGRVSPQTDHRYHLAIYYFFEYLRRRELVVYNYVRFPGVFKPLVARALDPEQLDILFKTLPEGKLRDACLIVYHTGMKLEELNSIVRYSYATEQLILPHRRVKISKLMVGKVEHCPRFRLTRLRDDLRAAVKDLDFEVSFSRIRLAFVRRAVEEGIPKELIRRQLGLSYTFNVTQLIYKAVGKKTLLTSNYTDYAS